MKKVVTLCILAGIFAACMEKIPVETVNLRCENLDSPVIDVSGPRLSWELVSEGRDVRQTSYRILVSSSLEKLNNDEGDLWDSRRVKSGNSVYIAYEGEPLNSRTEYFWKVRVKTNRGESAWSKPASWTMGLTGQADWQAKWTGLNTVSEKDVIEGKTRLAARYFRKEFNVPKKVEKATLYISGLGLYEAYINAGRIGEQVLSPTPTEYTKAVKYNTFDVTGQLKEGNNAIGVILGNGRFFTMRTWVRDFGFPRMIVQLEIRYSDGSRQTVVSDGSWKATADGPILANSVFDGEEYDARKEFPGWNSAGFDDSGWLQAELVDAPGGTLEAQANRNIKVMETVRPASISEIRPGIFVMDMGQNMVGWLRMKVKGKAGDEVKLRFAELLNDDGTLYVANLRSTDATDRYILKSSGGETWSPSFTYHGFRYVEISGFPGVSTLDSFEGRVVFDEIEATGEFETSDGTINQIYKSAYWGIKGNYNGMPTDCPQRDERWGWLGDRAVGSQGESFLFNINNLYAKWLDDIEQTQREDGSISNIAPVYHSGGLYHDNMTWPGAYFIVANMLYEQYGDRRPIEKHYESMKKWISYMEGKYLKDSIMTKNAYGDWCMPPESPELIHTKDPARRTDGAVLGTAYYYRILCLLEKFAVLLDRKDEAEAFAQKAEGVKNAFNNRYLNRETQQYSNNTVTANLLPLCYGMTPDEYREGVFRNIVDKTMNEYKGHVSSGLVGMQWFMRGLSEYGRPDVAYKIVTVRDYPGWGYMIEKGATTIWELWNGDTANPAMNSGNHVMLLGDLIIWFYEYLAGIQNSPTGVGFEEIVMKPYPVDGLNHVKASYKSARGLVKSEWTKANGQFTWNITVPCNSTA
ncbi:MAG: glycoside hydrolase family 78 protein, partial [Tannerella sp.]|nr:glycoside hydrolase family 78 protein [Tannerella sp.]